MYEKNHYCEYEVIEDLMFCPICGKEANIAGDIQ